MHTLRFDFGTFFSNLGDGFASAGSSLVATIGIILIVASVIMLAVKLASKNAHIGWFAIIGLFILGSLMLGGLGFFIDAGTGTVDSIREAGETKAAKAVIQIWR